MTFSNFQTDFFQFRILKSDLLVRVDLTEDLGLIDLLLGLTDKLGNLLTEGLLGLLLTDLLGLLLGLL